MLYLGTSRGLFVLEALGSTPRHAALQHGITHVAVAPSGVASAAVPVPGPVHKMYPADHWPAGGAAPADSGLHLVRPSPASGFSCEHVWAGDARSCGCWELPGSSSGGSTSRLAVAVGAEPADVFLSVDGGRSWSGGTDSFAAVPSRPVWSFPAPPHKPHVLSLELLPAAAEQRGAGSQGQGQGQGRLVAGIEVGGVLLSADLTAGSRAADAAEWEECSTGLYADVHSCRIDPHDPSHWLAVTGKGLYVSHNAGLAWQPQGSWAGRYTVGLAFSPHRKGEVLVAAGDRPPAQGAYVFRSTDGGSSWQDITEVVGGPEALGGRTPVPYFWQQHALLGTASGTVLGAADAGRREWRQLARLPHPVLCMCASGQSPSSVMH